MLAFLVATILCNTVKSQCNGDKCNNWDQIDLGNYLYVQSDPWGQGNAKQGWCECISGSTSEPASVNFEFWSNDGSNNHVMAYPSIVAGWNFGNYKYGQGKGGLPILTSDVQKGATLITSWTVSYETQNTNTTGDAFDVAWDIWFGPSNGQTNPGGPSGELMIWLNSQNETPWGKLIADDLKFWGTQWKFYLNEGGSGTPLWAFERIEKTWSVQDVDLAEFINYLAENKYVNSTQYVLGVQCGTELFQGHGTFTHKQYTLKVTNSIAHYA